MSNTYNQVWLENAKENFDAAIADGDYAMARAVVEDARDRGFDEEVEQLAAKLKKAKIDVFSFETAVKAVGATTKTLYGVNPYGK